MFENTGAILDFTGKIIGLVGTIIGVAGTFASVHFRKELKSYEGNLVNLYDSLKDTLENVSFIQIFAVNSYEIFNTMNRFFEQNPHLKISTVSLLLRKKPDEDSKYIEDLKITTDLWKRWVDVGQIGELTIDYYNYNPDHYYTIFGDKLVLCGLVFFDDTKPTGTTVDYEPLVFTDTNKLGQKIIKNYQHHFQNHVDKFKSTESISYHN